MAFGVGHTRSLVDDPQVGDRPGGDQGDVGVGDDEAAEGHPRERHVPGVQLADQAPRLVAQRVLAEVVELRPPTMLRQEWHPSV